MPPAGGSSTRGGSTSVRGRVRSPHMAMLRAASIPRLGYSLGWDRDGQTDASRCRLMPRPYGGPLGTIGVARILDWGSCELSSLNLFIGEISHNSQSVLRPIA